MDFLATVPPLIKILIIFALILTLNKFRCNLGAALLIGSSLLALWFGLGIAQTGRLIVLSLLSSQTLALLAIVSLVLILSRVMEKRGQMERIVSSFSLLLKSPRLSLAAIPALIGLLPMPGGAVVSAPIVDTMTSNSGISPFQKSIINYWFRHIWEYWWPLYPGVILAVSLMGIELSRFIVVQFPFTLVALLGGYLFIFLPIRKINLSRASFPTNPANRVEKKIIKESILNKTVFSMLFLIIGIMAFKEILQHSGAIVRIRENLSELNIPLPIMVALLPLVSGIVTGVTVGSVGPSFPVIVELVQTSGAGGELLPYAILAYGFGFMGVMLSPVHLCFILTKDFFGADIGKIYKRLLPLCLTVLTFAILMFWLLK
jgi:hypothetical protein